MKKVDELRDFLDDLDIPYDEEFMEEKQLLKSLQLEVGKEVGFG